LLRNCDLVVIDGPWSSRVQFRLQVSPKEIITGREIRRTCRPWTLAAQWNNMFRKHFSNDVHGCSRCMDRCTTLLEPYGRELNSTTT
jgi:hypothetical protein